MAGDSARSAWPWGAWLSLRFPALIAVPPPRRCRGSARLCCSPWAAAAPRPPVATRYYPKDSAATSAVSAHPPSNALPAGSSLLLGSAALTCTPVAGAIVSLTHDPTFNLELYRTRLLDLFLKQVTRPHGESRLLAAAPGLYCPPPRVESRPPHQPSPFPAPVPGLAGGCVQGPARGPHRDPGGAGGAGTRDRRSGAAGPSAPAGRVGTR